MREKEFIGCMRRGETQARDKAVKNQTTRNEGQPHPPQHHKIALLLATLKSERKLIEILVVWRLWMIVC
jgi:hypothetical protein